MTQYGVYTTQTPATADSNSPAGQRTLGMVFQASQAISCIGGRWYASSVLPTTAPSMSLWLLAGGNPLATTGTMVAQKSFVLASMVAAARNTVLWTTPITLTPNVPYQIQIETPDHYCFSSPNQWPKSNGVLSAYSDTAGGNGRFSNGAAPGSLAQPQSGSFGYDFFADVLVDDAPGGVAPPGFFVFF